MSDRTRELAVFVKKWRDEHAQGWHDQECCVNELLDELQPLLDAFERETRLDEAKWWSDWFYGQPQSGKLGIERLQEGRQRIAELAAQPTPEVKK